MRVSEESIVHVQGHRIKATRDEKRTKLWAFNKPRKVLTASAVSETDAQKATTAALLRQVSSKRHPHRALLVFDVRQHLFFTVRPSLPLVRKLDLPPHLVNVGRLDYNSEGLLLFTNNGALARALEHPTGLTMIRNHTSYLTLCRTVGLVGLM